MKNSFSLFIMLALVSCAKARKMPPYEFQQNGGGNLTDMLVVPEHQGALLYIKKKESVEGELYIKAKDAEKIYESLQVSTDSLGADQTFNAGKIKNGKYIYCMEQSKVASPKFIFYTCVVRVQLLSGLLSENKSIPAEDKSIPHLNSKYVGPNTVIEPTSGKILVSFREEDAKKLYSILSLSEIADETTYYKTGPGYGCQKIPVKKPNPATEIIAQPAVEIKNLDESKPEEVKKTPEIITVTEDKKATEEVMETEIKPIEVIPTDAPGMFAALGPEGDDQVIPPVIEANYECNIFLRITDGGMFFQ